jgi:Flp pilus assembly pilin Flp
MLAVIRELLRAPRRGMTKSKLLRQSEGAAAVEYAVLLALLIAGMLASIQTVGSQTNSLLRLVTSSLFSSGQQSAGAAAMSPTLRPPGAVPMVLAPPGPGSKGLPSAGPSGAAQTMRAPSSFVEVGN